jgi:hypothetical protein
MTPQDREAFQSLLLRQTQLENSLTQLRIEFRKLEHQVESQPDETAISLAVPPVLPPLPAPMVTVQEIEAPPAAAVNLELSPEPPPFNPPTESASAKTAQEKQSGLEFQFGRWLARIGVVFALITLISFSTLAYKHFHHLMGPWSRLTALALVSIGLTAGGIWLERKMTVYGRTLAGGGLACLYYTLYGATYVQQLQVIHSQLLGGVILLIWSCGVLFLAEKKKSELLSIFAIALAYFSSAITPVGDFTMIANLILSLTAVIFLVRNSWTGLSYLCLAGTYLGLLRQFLDYNSYAGGLAWVHVIAFWPAAIYLAGAWVIYTAGVFLAGTPQFVAGKRAAFLSLNNGALIGLLALSSYLSGFGHIGAMLCIVGGVFIATSYLARFMRADAADVPGAYLMQGLALGTGGLVMVYSGVTRGLLILVESVFLAASGAYSRNIIMRWAGMISALLGTTFLANEIVFGNHYPWILTFAGTFAMLINAWLARRELWNQPLEIAAAKWIGSSFFYVFLAHVLLVIGIFTDASAAWLAPDLAIATFVLTATIYFLPLIELPILTQGLLIIAQIALIEPLFVAPSNLLGLSAATYPDITTQPLWSQLIVGAITLILIAWWPRQKRIPTGSGLTLLLGAYALALVGIASSAVYPHVDAQGWMIYTSLLSLAFLVYGAWTRTWQLAVSGQIFLLVSIWAFLAPTVDTNIFPWTWWAAALPPAMVFITAWLTSRWLPKALTLSEENLSALRVVTKIYNAIALGLLVRWIFGVIPADDVTLAFFVLATYLLLGGRRPSAFGIRSALVIDLIGTLNYAFSDEAFSWSIVIGFLLFLAQPAVLRRWGRSLVTEAESWALILLSAGAAWFFISHSIDAEGSNNLTMGWALYALALVVIGFAANERRQRWCGLAILVAAIIRVGVYDFWGYSDLYKVLTFLALTVICLGLSFLYYKFADRLKEWL